MLLLVVCTLALLPAMSAVCDISPDSSGHVEIPWQPRGETCRQILMILFEGCTLPAVLRAPPFTGKKSKVSRINY